MAVSRWQRPYLCPSLIKYQFLRDFCLGSIRLRLVALHVPSQVSALLANSSECLPCVCLSPRLSVLLSMSSCLVRGWMLGRQSIQKRELVSLNAWVCGAHPSLKRDSGGNTVPSEIAGIAGTWK